MIKVVDQNCQIISIKMGLFSRRESGLRDIHLREQIKSLCPKL